MPAEYRWALRAVPALVATAGAVAAQWAGFWLGLAGGWVLALVLATVLDVVHLRVRQAAWLSTQGAATPARRATDGEDAAPVETPDDPAPSDRDVGTEPPTATDAPQLGAPTADGAQEPGVAPPSAPGPAPTAPRVPRPSRVVQEDTYQRELGAVMRDVHAAEPVARQRNKGFLAGEYALVGTELLSLATWDDESVWVRVSLAPGENVEGVRRHHDRSWIRPEPRGNVRATVRYRALAEHRSGAVLHLVRWTSSRTIYAEWHRYENNDASDTIPPRFLWEKNDDYYYGEVEPGSLSRIRDRRGRVLLGEP